ncbi:MAG: hypothetical protein K0M50_04095 [Prolixibacteraceae bacterium]|nr:hypothetical protein [Prolixibacteraceae bacterium]
MTDTEYYELAKSFFYHIIQYGYENMEVNLKKEIRNYITRVNRAIELKLDTDADFYSGVILRYLKELNYFEPSQNIPNCNLFKLTEKGKSFLKSS